MDLVVILGRVVFSVTRETGGENSMHAVGGFIGAIIGMALFGAILAWVLRLVFPTMSLSWSYALGLGIMIWPAGWSWNSNHAGTSLAESLFTYGVAAIFAFFVLVSTSSLGGSGRQRERSNNHQSRKRIFRFLGWVLFSLLAAFGATCMFAALKGNGSDATVSFFMGALCIIGAFFLWKALTKKPISAPYNQLPSEQEP